MIRCTYFRLFICTMKNEKNNKKKSEKHHVSYIPSFRFSFSGSIIEKEKL